MSEEIVLNRENFDKEVLESDLPVVVDFWAEWCGPCRMIAPIIEELATEYKGQLKVAKLNVDENPDIASRYGIKGIPTLIFFKNGEVIERIIGVQPKETLKTKIDELLK